jgi:hypothetical protein
MTCNAAAFSWILINSSAKNNIKLQSLYEVRRMLLHRTC